MATSIPTLEQLTGSLDDLPVSLDNLNDLPFFNLQLEQLSGSLDDLPASLDSLGSLPWCNPTLDQLGTWGSLEYIATFGYTLEELDKLDRLCVLVASATASVSLSATGEIFDFFARASVNISVDTSANATSDLVIAGVADAALSVAVSPHSILKFSGSASVATAASGSVNRVKETSAAEQISVSGTGVFVRQKAFDSAVSANLSVVCASHVEGRFDAIAAISVSSAALGKYELNAASAVNINASASCSFNSKKLLLGSASVTASVGSGAIRVAQPTASSQISVLGSGSVGRERELTAANNVSLSTVCAAEAVYLFGAAANVSASIISSKLRYSLSTSSFDNTLLLYLRIPTFM